MPPTTELPLPLGTASALEHLGQGYPIRRLMFLSSDSDPIDCVAPSWLQSMVDKASLANAQLGITGCLIHVAPYLVHVMEGMPDAVDALYNDIASDPRHCDCTIVLDLQCFNRMYKDWTFDGGEDGVLTKQPMVRFMLAQVTKCVIGMWPYFPGNAAELMLKGVTPTKKPPQTLQAVIAFIHLCEYQLMLCQAALAEHLADILGNFVDICVQHVGNSGGQVAKFINGCCMAYWPQSKAPEAMAGIHNILNTVSNLRSSQPPGSAVSLLHAYVGVHNGMALLCNAGTKKADFTLLGDSVNTCARLACLAVKLRVQVLMSFDMAVLLGDNWPIQLKSMGQHAVEGRDKPVHCYCADYPGLEVEEIRNAIQQFCIQSACKRLAALRAVRSFVDLDPPVRRPIFSQTFEPNLASSPAITPRNTAWAAPDLFRVTCICQCIVPAETYWETIQYTDDIHNTSAGITSATLMYDELLAHSMEGPKAAVLALWNRFLQEKHHKGAVLIGLEEISDRIFQNPLEWCANAEVLHATDSLCLRLLGQLTHILITLERYVPCIVLRYLASGLGLRQLQPAQVEMVMLATDMCAFTLLSETCSLRGVWQVCTAFTDCCTTAIRARGGEMLKLIGDCVTAYFPSDCAVDAMEAAQDIVRSCREMRNRIQKSGDCRSLVYCGVGLDMGLAVIMHCGSHQTKDLTVTGEVSVRVLAVEALTRKTGYAITMTAPVAALLPSSFPSILLPHPSSASLDTECYALQGAEWRLRPCLVREQIRCFHENPILHPISTDVDATLDSSAGASASMSSFLSDLRPAPRSPTYSLPITPNSPAFSFSELTQTCSQHTNPSQQELQPIAHKECVWSPTILCCWPIFHKKKKKMPSVLQVAEPICPDPSM